MRKLWGRLSSINVQKAVWALDEIGLHYERTDMGGSFGITDAYRAMNPNALVPTLVEPDGFTLWESNAIVRYLSATHSAGDLWPTDPRERAEADRWMDWQTTLATPGLRDAFWQLIRFAEKDRDTTAIARSVEASAAAARTLDAHLADRSFVAGDRFTMGDIPVACHVQRWSLLPIDRPELPNLRRWFAAVRERPGARQIVALALS